MSDNQLHEPTASESDPRRTRRNVVRGLALIGATAASVAAGTLKANALSGRWTEGGLDRPKGSGGHCFLAGTMIVTEQGEKPVEQLVVGDAIVSPDGSVQLVRATRTRQAGRAWGEDVAPVKIARSALAPAIPSRDLYLSAKHALLVDGVLIRSEALINGRTITRCTDIETDLLSYFHIELDTHAIVIANGVAAESFLAPGMTRCAPLGIDYGRRAEMASRARSAASHWYDVRTPFDRARDRLDHRAEMIG